VSPENLEPALDAYARYNAGERKPALWFWHADGEYHTSGADPDTDEAVRALGRRVSRPAGRATGSHVLTLEHGRVRRTEAFMDRAEGLTAAGIAE
jgi:hypothetical protein